jgi:hypothetical protein
MASMMLRQTTRRRSCSPSTTTAAATSNIVKGKGGSARVIGAVLYYEFRCKIIRSITVFFDIGPISQFPCHFSAISCWVPALFSRPCGPSNFLIFWHPEFGCPWIRAWLNKKLLAYCASGY